MGEVKLFKIPNLRKLMAPDHDHILISADLAGADAQVVAWEADDADLKAAFRAGWKIHAHNALAMWGPEVVGEDGKKEPYYTRVKSGVHLTNYGGKAKTLARVLNSSVREAEIFQSQWFHLHPGIPEWHQRVWDSLNLSRSVENKFGFKIRFYDRLEDATFREALAWIPQSTVALVTDKGLVNVHEQLKQVIPLGQIHDEGLYQTHRRYWPDILPDLYPLLQIPIPYDDELTIPVNLKASWKSWGDCVPVPWDPKEAEAILNGASTGQLAESLYEVHSPS